MGYRLSASNGFKNLLKHCLSVVLLVSINSCYSGLGISQTESLNRSESRIYITAGSGFEPQRMEKKLRRYGFRFTDSVPHLNIWIARIDTMDSNPERLAKRIKKSRAVKSFEFEREFEPMDSGEN